MRARTTHDSPKLAAGALAIVVAVSGLVGCGGKNNTATTSTTTTSAGTGTQFEIGNTINYGSVGTTTHIDCANGKSLNVGGSNNTLTVTGTCSSVSIGGADNKITFDQIDKDLSVVGINNTITYKTGDPTVENLGSGNTVKKG